MAKARSGRKVARKISGKSPSRGSNGASGSKKARSAKRKPVKLVAAHRAGGGAKARPRGAQPSRPAGLERARIRKPDVAAEMNQLPEIPPPLPAPIASFTF